MPDVTVKISSKWVSIINSPLMWVIWALQGVSITFAPLFLYWSGKGWFFPEAQWIVIPSCFVVILLIPLFYMFLGSLVVKQLRERKDESYRREG